ncbi:MAG: sugar transporter periplasmatic substrate-binding protein [Conexibacter sp.]|nr:sugar transporter periplasmatic substrate-binding protein [Conexibacter sp.]
MRTTAAVRWATGAAACAALLAAGCGGSDGGASTSAAADSGAASASASAGVTAAQKEVDAYRGVPQFKAPGEPFDAKKAVAGKTLMSIPSSSSIPFVQTLQVGVKQISGDVGMKFLDWPNQGQPVQWVQGMNAGLSRKVSAINLMAGNNPGSVAPQVKQAQAAKIPVIASHLYGVGDTPAAGVDTVSAPYEQAGRLLADWIVAKTGGKADTLVVKIDEVVSTKPMMKGINDVFAKACASACPVSTINVAIADVASKIAPQVQAALVKDPKINYIVGLYDSAEAPFIVSAIKQAGAGKRVKVVTFNGTPSVLKLVKNGDVEMDVAENLDWISYAVTDQAMRLIAGLPPVKDPQLPLRIYDKDNVAEAGTNADTAEGFGDAFKGGYRKLWGLDG